MPQCNDVDIFFRNIQAVMVRQFDNSFFLGQQTGIAILVRAVLR